MEIAKYSTQFFVKFPIKKIKRPTEHQKQQQQREKEREKKRKINQQNSVRA